MPHARRRGLGVRAERPRAVRHWPGARGRRGAGGADAAPRALVLAAAAVFFANRPRTVPPASEASVLYAHALFRALAFWACALHADGPWFSRHGCVVGLSLGYALHVCVVFRAWETSVRG